MKDRDVRVHARHAHGLHHDAVIETLRHLTLRRAVLALAVVALYALVMAAALRWSQPWIAREGGEVAATPAGPCPPLRGDSRCGGAGDALGSQR
jgi:hypothetical protein